jgi:hypothetical protein
MNITINRESNKMSIDIYRKPTHADIVILNDSCHPRENKMAAIYYLYNKKNTNQLSPKKRQKESTYIQEILKNNEYNTTVLEITPRRVKLKQDKNKTQWAKFTYWK